ncbi:hypothetical protein AAG570_009915 [Ranatra chinensis]|uniref:Peptidase C14 caspase domain-containing protein n=1 Tax=Ranatra chinensis TaxID=642074 RepID=A0ABD0ZDS5_9HEMI
MERLRRLWRGFGYRVFLLRNVTKEQLKDTIESMLKIVRGERPLMVHVLGRARAQDLSTSIAYTAPEGPSIESQWIVDQFAPLKTNKVFFFLGPCDGLEDAIEEDGVLMNASDSSGTVTVYANEPENFQGKDHAEFIYTKVMCKVFTEDGGSSDLQSMVEKVNGIVDKHYENMGCTLIKTESLGFEEKVYLK